MRSFRHWTPRYVFDRSKDIWSNRLHPDWPWMAPDAVKFLDLWLRPTDDVFEWGSGRSTTWIARRVRSITSVEANEDWLARVRTSAEENGLRNVDLRYFPQGEGSDHAPGYVSFIRLAGIPFDVVVVDGFHRDYCALAAMEHLKPGGLLVIDDIGSYLPSPPGTWGPRRHRTAPQSEQWATFNERVKNWRRIWTSSGVKDTALWFKTP